MSFGCSKNGCLDLPKRLELPERPPKYWKDQRIIGNSNMLSTKFMLSNVLIYLGLKVFVMVVFPDHTHLLFLVCVLPI